MAYPMRPSITAFGRRMVLKIKDLDNPFPGGLSFKYFLDWNRFNPFGPASVKVKNDFF
jgi:hypothetical protein